MAAVAHPFVLTHGQWYWVRLDHGHRSYEGPARYRACTDGFYAEELHGIPADQVQVFGEITRPAAAVRHGSSDYAGLPAYIYGRETAPNERVYSEELMRQFADETHALRVAAAMASAPVRIYDYVWIQREEDKENCSYACNYSPAQHLAKGELLAVVHPSQIPGGYLKRKD